MDESESRPQASPLARGAGCVFVLLLLFGTMGTKVSEISLAYAVGYTVGQTALLFAILYFTSLRGIAFWKSAAVFGGLFLVVGFFTLAKTGQAIGDFESDAAAMAEFRYDNDGNLIVPEGKAAGPLSTIAARLARENAALIASHERDLTEFGVFDMMDASKLQSNPGILARCESFEKLRSNINKYRLDQIAFVDKAQADFAAVDLPAEIKEGVLSGMRNSIPDTKAKNEQFWQLRSDQMSDAQSICTVLAERRWRAKGAIFEFTAADDMRTFNEANNRMVAIDDAIQKLVSEHVATQRQRLERMKQELN